MAASTELDVAFASEPEGSGLIAVPMPEGGTAALDEATGGALGRAARAAEVTGKAGQSVTVPAPQGFEDALVMVVGTGEGQDADAARAFGGKAAAGASKHRTLTLDLRGSAFGSAAHAAAAAQGAVMRAYAFEAYKKKAEPDALSKLRRVLVVTDDPQAAEGAYEAAGAVARGVALARDLVSEPPNVLYPESFAERCRELESLGVEVEILGEVEMTKLGMCTLLGVGQGSIRESKLAVMRWKGGDGQTAGGRPIALVGKGVTFDTGGISLKPGAGMEEMKMDMGGAAAVTGAMAAIAGRKAKADVVGLIGLVENMPDGAAQRPADIVTSMSGQTVEILNTDAEGRLVLADVLTYAQERFKPSVIVDLATLTGAILISLADQYGGLFTEHEDLAGDLLAAGEASGEKLWRMPLGDAHRDMIKSDVADMKNIGGRDGGSSSAAAFLSRFVGDEVPWAHLDIAGMAWTKKDQDLIPKGATGYGVRLLDAFVREREG